MLNYKVTKLILKHIDELIQPIIELIQKPVTDIFTSRLNTQLIWCLGESEEQKIIPHIKKIIEKISFSWSSVEVFGTATVPGEDKSVPFQYTWGTSYKLSRAPWEGDDVPEVRKIKTFGELED